MEGRDLKARDRKAGAAERGLRIEAA